jgi:hypothetical protein
MLAHVRSIPFFIKKLILAGGARRRAALERSSPNR